MITSGDAANIIYRDLDDFSITERYHAGDEPEGEILTERIIIHTKQQTPETYWEKNFLEVNLCVPDKDGQKDKIRTDELERESNGFFHKVGEYDDTVYRYSISSMGVEKDGDLKCHYVNVKILFEVLNIKG